jgi:hypothetical protein
VKHKEHSTKPYSKDLSEAQRAFYKAMKDYIILEGCIKEKKNTKDAYHVNKTKTEVYR